MAVDVRRFDAAPSGYPFMSFSFWILPCSFSSLVKCIKFQQGEPRSKQLLFSVEKLSLSDAVPVASYEIERYCLRDGLDNQFQ
jgi:hypothetical protein